MLNFETAGSELLKVKNDPDRSTDDIIINEDWCMVMKVISISEGIVEAVKVWDSGDTRFFARLKYHGKAGTPDDDELEVGEHVIFNRVGEFNNNGSEGFELHDTDINKTSWVCFIEAPSFLWIIDNGDGTGTAAGETLSLVVTDPLSSFYNDTPPWLSGRSYLGQKSGTVFIVYLSGKGPLSETFTQTAGDITWTLTTDSTGKVLDFVAEAAV